MILQHPDYGQVELVRDGNMLKATWKLKQPIRLGYNTHAGVSSTEQRYEQLSAGESSAEYPLGMPKEVPADCAVFLNAAIRTPDGKRQLHRQEERLARAAQAVSHDAATAAHAEAWEAPPGATANQV